MDALINGVKPVIAADRQWEVALLTTPAAKWYAAVLFLGAVMFNVFKAAGFDVRRGVIPWRVCRTTLDNVRWCSVLKGLGRALLAR